MTLSTGPRPVLGRLQLAGFRNLDLGGDRALRLSSGLNLFSGANGQGKTNLLEAVHLLSTGKSFRGATAREMIGFGQAGIRILGEVQEESGPVTLAVELAEEPVRTRRFLVGSKSLTPSGYLGLLPSIAVAAERMGIVRGAPEERRRFVDRGLLLEEPSLADLFREVGRILRQKGALLAASTPERIKRGSLSAWNEELAGCAARLRRARRRYVDDLATRLPEISRDLGRPSTPLRIAYRPSPEGVDAPEAILERLEAGAAAEISAGRCRLGPGRDEIEILVDGHPARQAASAGEQKAIVLAMKIAKIERADALGLARPLLLLDDLDAELDREVFAAFLRRLPVGHQVLATSAKPEWIEPLLPVSLASGPTRRFRVFGGRIEENAGDDEAPAEASRWGTMP